MKRLLNKKSALFLILSILWMCVIFTFSAQPREESSNISGGLLRWVLHALDLVFQGKIPGFISAGLFASDHYIRKAGHFAEYFILGILWLNTFKSMRVKKALLFSIVICALYASTDEIHQIFVPGRGPMITDVLLDSLAAAAGTAIAWLLTRRRVNV
jgi:VanZ family protein